MNTGIQDAVNLGWKLAAVLGGADDTVLDTYDTERHPVGALVLRTSGATLRLMTVRPWILRRLRNTLISSVLRVPKISTKIAGMFSGVGIAYGHGRGEHRLVGTRAADVPTDSGRLYEVLRSGGFVLVTENSTEAASSGEAAGYVRTVRRTDDGPALLVRPDGYVAWAGSSTSDGWRAALERWTGPVPAERVASR